MPSAYLSDDAETQRYWALVRRVAAESFLWSPSVWTFPPTSDYWKLPHSFQVDCNLEARKKWAPAS